MVGGLRGYNYVCSVPNERRKSPSWLVFSDGEVNNREE